MGVPMGIPKISKNYIYVVNQKRNFCFATWMVFNKNNNYVNDYIHELNAIISYAY